jgi:hypothetical protein
MELTELSLFFNKIAGNFQRNCRGTKRGTGYTHEVPSRFRFWLGPKLLNTVGSSVSSVYLRRL